MSSWRFRSLGLRHHPHRRRLRGFGYFRRIGPGLVTGASDDDPSGIGTYAQVGTAFRYGMLWTALVSLPLAVAVQETAARLGLTTGKGLASLIRERFPRPVVTSAVALVAAANTFNIGADLGSMAASLRLLGPVPQAPAVVGLAAGLVALEVLLPYHRYARVLRWLTLSLGTYVAVLFAVRVPWAEVARGTFLPAVRPDRAALAALIAVFGTTISPYLYFWQTSEEVEEELERGESPEVATAHLSAMRWDVLAGMVSAVGVMFAIMVASAATLGTHGVRQVLTADQAARALQPVAGRFASLLFAAGIVGTGALAVPVLAGATAYALAEAFGWSEGLSRRPREAPGFYGTVVAATGLGVAMGLLGVNPMRALYWSAILNGLAAPPLLLLMLALSRAHRRAGGGGGEVLSEALVAAACVLMAALPLAYLLS
jgi:NRAMP (natural resistance-associated macrophage protein)-like metal ion transporter